MRDIYNKKAPHNKQVNIGHFPHGDCVGAATAKDETFKRGDKVYLVATGDDVGKVTKTATGNIDLGYWVKNVSSGS